MKSMQVYTRKYLEHFSNLRIAKIQFDSCPTPSNEKKLLELRKMKWTNTTKYTRSYRKFCKQNKNFIETQKMGYDKLAGFLSKRILS